jgi:hypothetical protein
MRLPKKISALPGVSTIKNADLFAIVQDGVTSKVTFQVLEGVISGFTASADTYVTGGVYNSGTTSIDFTGNTDFPPFSVNVSDLTGTTGGGGTGTTCCIDPYNNVGSASTLTWDVSGTSTNYKITLTANTILTMSNVRDGDSGNLIIFQDSAGNKDLTFSGGTHYIVNGGDGSTGPTLTTNANTRDILSFTYDGDEPAFYWTVGNDYT